MRAFVRVVLAGIGVALALAAAAGAQKPPLLPEKDVAALANELSGEAAKRNLEGIARFHRQRGSSGFHEAAELVAERLRAYGLSDVAILQFPADGATMYGTQRSRPAWDAEVGRLYELQPEIEGTGGASPDGKTAWAGDSILWNEKLLANYEAEPIVLAEDSESADVKADLVDVGEGTKQSDYAGKDVKAKIVLVGAQPGAVQDLAVGKFGAVGIVSYVQNQKTAWWGEDENLIRWGHLETFSANKTFAFMVSLKTARAMKGRLANGEKITLHAVVKAGQHPGFYEVLTALIPGADPKLKFEEIAFSCHLDHQRPGANDNASGCATILEVARTLQKLINEGKLARPARTIRFIFPPEIEGTLALLNGQARFSQPSHSDNPDGSETIRFSNLFLLGPELAKRIKAVVHMDMVGGGPETKAVFHVTRGPMSLPSFVHDVAWAFAEWVNEESYKFAATGKAEYPVVAPEGGKEPLRAEYSAYTMGSDHDVYQDSSFGIPAIYLNDWPDRYIHTNFDTAANIDPTKLKRAAFIGAASGYFLAKMDVSGALGTTGFIADQAGQARMVQNLQRMAALTNFDLSSETVNEHDVFVVQTSKYESQIRPSVKRIVPQVSELQDSWDINGDPAGQARISKAETKAVGEGLLKFKRRTEPRGPLVVFGYDYFEVEWVKLAYVKKPQLLEYVGLWGAGEEYAYEVLNFADGKRNAREIRDAVSAEYGPVPLELVVEYLRALEKIGVIERMK
jgi:aminopeptidase YwaD